MTIRVALVDDDALVLAGLRMLLAGDPELEVVAESSDGHNLSDLVDQDLPDVVLLDVRMPRVDGVTALRALRARHLRHPAVIMLTTFGAEPVVLEALAAGADGFLLKHTPPDQIIAAIHQSATGEATVSPQVLRQLIDRVAQSPDRSEPDPLEGITDRERDVALLVSEGLPNSEIARRLYISTGSVKAHVSSALTKLGLDNRVQLAIAAYESRRRNPKP